MAESIAGSFERHDGGPGPIVHFTGAFHSDFGTGTLGARAPPAPRPPRRRGRQCSRSPASTPSRRTATISRRADYLVYTIKE